MIETSKPLVGPIDWDALPWQLAEVVTYEGRVLMRKDGFIHCIGIAPTFTASYEQEQQEDGT